MVGIGVVTGRIYSDMSNSTRILDKLASVGTQYIRIEFEEHGASFTPESAYDKILADAQSRNVRVLGVLSSNSCPFKTFEPRNDQPSKPTELETYIGEFYKSVKYHMKRYPYVREWEIWNEPDQYGFKNHETNYGLLLKRVYEAVQIDRKNGDISRDIRIVSAGIVNSEKNVLMAIYDTNPVKDFRAIHKGDIPCDIFSYHPYGGAPGVVDPNTNAFYGNRTFEKGYVELLRGLSTSYYQPSVPLIPSSKPIWITEFGFNTAKITPEKQADYLRKMVEAMQRLGHPIERAFIYDFQDDKSGTGKEQFGLLDTNFNQKMAWNAYAGFPK